MTTSTPVGALERARALITNADRVFILTGAGVSAESGVPTFRGAGGLWRDHRAEDLATPEAFARDPDTVLEWYRWRRAIIRGCEPNPAHLALAELALRGPGRVTIATQNVDGLHTAAASAAARSLGVDSAPALPLELHGAIMQSRCSACGMAADDPDADYCSRCGGRIRPGVVWFGETLDPAVLGAAHAAAQAADVCLVVGTSALVHPAAGLADVTRRAGGAVIEVNLDATPISATAAVTLRGPAAEIVPALVRP